MISFIDFFIERASRNCLRGAWQRFKMWRTARRLRRIAWRLFLRPRYPAPKQNANQCHCKTGFRGSHQIRPPTRVNSPRILANLLF